MSKYIIEIPDDVQYVLLNGKADHKYYTAVHPIAELEELNSDYINEHFSDLQDTAYQRGLDDAWEAVRKIALMDTETSENVTGYFGLFRIMENLTPMQAIEKLKAYEEKQKSDDKIKVGDVVKPSKNVAHIVVPFVVTKVSDGSVWGVDAEGSWNYWGIDEVIKTDKHFDIEKILEEMRE